MTNAKTQINPYQSRSVRLRQFVKYIVTFGFAFALGHRSQSKRRISDRDVTSVTSSRGTRTHSSWAAEDQERNSFTTTKDPYLGSLDCLEFLDSYRKKEVSQLRDHTVQLPYHKSYVRLTNTLIPFYVSTNDAKVDRMRVDMFMTGEYYETAMSSSMQMILEEESKRLKAVGQQKRPIMLDVGGNIGWFSLLAAAHNAEVFVFEPNVVNMVRFCESLVLNGWASSSNPRGNQVHPFLKGVSNKHGIQEKMYKVDPSNPGSFSFSKETADAASRLHGYAPATALEDMLQLITLDALAQDQKWHGDSIPPIAILKIDVEGLELKVLQGAKKLLRSQKVKNVFLELKSNQKFEEWEAMFSILLESGYELYKIGDHLGPTDIVTTKFINGKELASDIAKRSFENANIWLRLSE